MTRVATPSREDLPEVVRTVCDAHAALLDERLPGLLEGLYLHGSVGFDGEFHGGSDIDFVAVTSRRPDDGEVDVLRQVHAELDKRRPEPAYDGFYVVADDLAGSPDVVPDVPGVLHQWFDVGTHCDVKHITWRELRDHGITVRGKALRDLVIWSDDAALHASTRENLDTYWRSQLEAMHHHPREASLPQAAEWGALGAPRLVHLLLTGTPTSKSGAAAGPSRRTRTTVRSSRRPCGCASVPTTRRRMPPTPTGAVVTSSPSWARSSPTASP